MEAANTYDKRKSRKWFAVKVGIWTHFPILLAGLVRLFMDNNDGAVTLTLGTLGSLIIFISSYAKLNIDQKKIEATYDG